MARVLCPNPACKKILALTDESMGRKVRCKVCKTAFVATPMAESDRAVPAGDGDVITVLARWVGVQAAPPRLRSNVFVRPAVASSEFAPGSSLAIPNARRQPRRMWFAAVAAVVFVVAVGSFFAFRWLDKKGEAITAPGAAEQSIKYGTIEISNSGLKYVVFELSPDAEYGYDTSEIEEGSRKTNLTGNMEASGVFDPSGLKQTASAVLEWCLELKEKYQLADERILVLSSAGLFGPLDSWADAEKKAKLIEKNKIDLAGAVAASAGKRVHFPDLEQEVLLQIEGCVRPKHLDTGLYIDIGGGSTRGGYKDKATGIVRKLKIIGVKSFHELANGDVTKNGGTFAQGVDRLAPNALYRPLHRLIENDAGMRTRKQVYLGGGICWVMGTCLHPDQFTSKEVYIKLQPGDIDSFAKAVRETSNYLDTIRAPADLSEAQLIKFKREIENMKKNFPSEKLIAGAEILKALAKELDFGSRQEIWFCRHSINATMYGFAAEKNQFTK
jgi:hypothetical protein